MALNSAVISDMKNNRDNITDAVLHVELLKKSTIYHFQGGYFDIIQEIHSGKKENF